MLLKNVKLQFLAVLGLGALLGYAAAHGKVNPFAKADVGPADQPKVVPTENAILAGLAALPINSRLSTKSLFETLTFDVSSYSRTSPRNL
jgi:hypothetical protein